MRVLHVGIGEIVSFGDHIRLNLTGWVDGTWYVYIEAQQDNVLGEVDGFRASAPCGFGWRAHVLALFDGDAFEIGPVRVRIGDAREDAGTARALRDAQFEVDAPKARACRATKGRDDMARLVLNRRTGESLHIGNAVRLTVRDRRGSCVLVAVAAPLDVLVADEGDALRPAATSSDGAFYLLWLLTGESLQIGEASIVVGEAAGAKRKVRGGQRQIRIAVIAPPGLVIRREEIARAGHHASPQQVASAHVTDTHGYVVEDAA